MTPREVHHEEAVRWLLANRDGASSAARREEFLAWLRESPQHVAAYLSAAGTADALAAAVRELDVTPDRLVAEATAAEAAVLPFPRRAADASGAAEAGPVAADGTTAASGSTATVTRPDGARRVGGRRVYAVATAAALAVAAVAVGWRIAGPPARVPAIALETAHGEQGSWPLADGSVVHLNSASAAVVRFDRAVRRVELQRGQAMFHVAKDPARAFRVQVGAVEVVALGTAFDVDRRDAHATLVVVEGSVAVTRGGRPGVVVPAGLQLDLMAADASPRPADVRRATAWVQREIVFDATPLAEVASEFNRYTAVPIAVEGATLRNLPISGVFGAYDVDSFLAFLARLEGVAIERRPDRVRVYPRPATPTAGRRSAPSG